MNVYVCFWIKSKTLPILSGQPKEVCCQMKVKGCFWCPSLCCWCVLSHLMLFDVFESDTTVHPPCYVSFYWGGRGVSIKPFGNFLPVAYTDKQTNTHLFYAHQQWRNPKSTSLNNGHKETSSMQHQCRAFSHIAVLSICIIVFSYMSSLKTNLYLSLSFACVFLTSRSFCFCQSV